MTDMSRRRMLRTVAGGSVAAGLAGTRFAHADSTTPANTADHAALVTPQDARYPDLVRGSNMRWVGTPEAVRVARTADQVVAALQDAVDRNKRVSVRSGGHCYENFVFDPDVDIVLDLSAMTEVGFDGDVFTVQPGARLLHVYTTLYRTWGVTIPGGSCYSVGAGGHISGGGYGLLSRIHGLTVDHLYGVEVVVVDTDGTARLVRATREPDDPHRDLFWAHTGGGGGNFGVVTRYLLRSAEPTGSAPTALLPTPPGSVFVCRLSWPWHDLTRTRFQRLMHNYGTWHQRHAQPHSPECGIATKLGLNTRPAGDISLLIQADATQQAAEQRLERFIDDLSNGVGTPHGERRRFPWLIATRELGGSGSDWTRYGDYKSAYQRTPFPDEHLAAMYRHLTSTDISDAVLEVHSYGGAVNATPSGETAISQRDSIMKLQYMTFWRDPDREAEHRRWLRELYADVYRETGGVPAPGEVTDGCYVNYPDTDLGDPRWNRSGVAWHDLYYKRSYPLLQRVKARWDPTDTFRHAQSVRLPTWSSS